MDNNLQQHYSYACYFIEIINNLFFVCFSYT